VRALRRIASAVLAYMARVGSTLITCSSPPAAAGAGAVASLPPPLSTAASALAAASSALITAEMVAPGASASVCRSSGFASGIVASSTPDASASVPLSPASAARGFADSSSASISRARCCSHRMMPWWLWSRLNMLSSVLHRHGKKFSDGRCLHSSL
jgi:hypothetical protein